MSLSTQQINFQVGDHGTVSGLVQSPPDPVACYVFAHGAGAGMGHAFMGAVSDGLAARGIATLRYQFPSMELGRSGPIRRPSPMPPCARRWRRRWSASDRCPSSRAASPSAGG